MNEMNMETKSANPPPPPSMCNSILSFRWWKTHVRKQKEGIERQRMANILVFPKHLNKNELTTYDEGIPPCLDRAGSSSFTRR